MTGATFKASHCILGDVALPAQSAVERGRLVLSLFPGIDLLGRGFEEAGFCLVRGPDKIFGGDIRTFEPPAGAFDGVIAGSPCQDFSQKRREPPSGEGDAMLAEFIRVVEAVQPSWWLLENVPGVPDVQIDGYSWQRLDVRASEFGLKQRRLRHIQFGSRDDTVVVLPREDAGATEPAILASDMQTGWDKFLALQGLPPDFDLPSFTKVAARRAVGNGVPLPVARALGRAVMNRVPAGSVKVCICGCARPVQGAGNYAKGSSCRSRVFRRKQK